MGESALPHSSIKNQHYKVSMLPLLLMVKGRRGINTAEFICGAIVTAEKPKALWDLSTVRDIPGFSHRHGRRLPVEGAVVTL